jgi:predicted ester cyclase
VRLLFCAAVVVVAGGALGGFGISAPLLLYRERGVGFSIYDELLNDFNLMASVGIVLTTASLLGLYALLGGLRSRIGTVGAVFTIFSIGALLVLLVDELRGSPLSENYLLLDRPTRLAEDLFFVSYWGRQLGLLFLGIAALGADVMGQWRFLPLAICALEAPIVADALHPLFRVFLDDDAKEAVGYLLFFGLPGWRPGVVSSVGWMLMGYVFVRSGRKLGYLRAEAATLAVEERNLALARSLYAEAWGRGDLSVVDEVVSSEFLDHRLGSRGSKEYGRAIENLRRTFPDLLLSLEEQRAEGDTVTTRCVFSGTDGGGVLWYPPTGREATFTATFTDRFSAGKLVEHWGGADTAGLLQQLGLPLPGR